MKKRTTVLAVILTLMAMPSYANSSMLDIALNELQSLLVFMGFKHQSAPTEPAQQSTSPAQSAATPPVQRVVSDTPARAPAIHGAANSPSVGRSPSAGQSKASAVKGKTVSSKNGGLATVNWPLREEEAHFKTYISSPYGEREAGTTAQHCDGDGVCLRNHSGIDIVAKEGTPVKETQGGVVMYIDPGCGKSQAYWNEAGKTKKAGCYVTVLNPETGLMSQYLHLKTVKDNLAVGQQVGAGDVVGYVGHTGDPSITAHLHYGVCDLRGKTAQVGASGCAGGSHIDPASVLNPKDSRAVALNKISQARAKFIACRRAAKRDSKAIATCRRKWRADQASSRSSGGQQTPGPVMPTYKAITDRSIQARGK